MRLVPTKKIPEDAELAEPLYNAVGKILLPAGVKLSKAMIEKINENNIFSVYVNDQHSQGKIEHLVNPLLRLKGYTLVKKIFDAASNKKPDGTPDPLPILDLTNELNKLMDDAIYDMKGVRDRQLEYIDIKNTSSYLYSSAINVALLSVLIGWELGLANDMIKHLFIGGIFHDIGLAMLPPEIIYKKDQLTLEDKKEIIKHPIKGYEYLKDKIFLSSHVRAITLGHHEHVDGSGYPNRKRAEDIHLLTQIVGLADIYDAMTSDRPYRQAIPANEVIEYIMSNANTHFDTTIIKAFMKKINPFPVGSLVELNTNQIAVVKSVSPNAPLRPKISVINITLEGYEYTDIDLSTNNSLTIKGLHY